MFKHWFILPVFFVVFNSCSKKTERSSTNNNSGGSTDTATNTGTVTTNSDYFLYGSNMGYYSGWTDQQLSEILIGNSSKNIDGAGVNSLRPAMYEYFVEQWGYNIRSDAFAFYKQLGATNNVIFLGYPSEAHRDTTKYCSNNQSLTFANLYEPIWNSDGSVNNNNYYAKYVYNVVKTYGAYVKFWEVWNEPDYASSWSAAQTWSTTNPNPCDLTGFYAPIQRYVRMLHITYEVAKSIDKNAVVCLGGIGYDGFLDAVLRNTENPTDGSVSSTYNKKGGEWFDCVSFHIYPMYNLNSTNKNSDAAANTIVSAKSSYQAVLTKYGYNSKSFIITECNIPRKELSGYIGSDEAQRNFLIKAAIACQKENILGLYVFGPADNQTYAAATDPYQVMGFYQPITSTPYPYNVTPNSSAKSWRTVSSLLKDRLYSLSSTTAMKLPSNIDGAAFYSATAKNFIYVLWAKSSGNTETASATYTFPSSLGITNAAVYTWDNQTAGKTTGSINLTGSPVFVKQ